MSEKTIERLGLSVAGGVLIPFFYTFFLFVLGGVFNFLGSGVSGEYFAYLEAPVTWAGSLYNYFVPTQGEPVYALWRREVWVASIIGDFLLYALLTYLFVRARAKRKLR